MSPVFELVPRDRAADVHLGEVPAELLSDRLFQSCELVERFVTDLALRVAGELGLETRLRDGATVADLAAALGGDVARAPLAWLLERLAEWGEIEAETGGGATVYRARGPLRVSEVDALRAIGLGIDPAIRPSLDVLEAAAASFPAVVSGAQTGEQALFSGPRMQLWLDYFDNRNPIYALNNRIAAVAAAHRLRDGGGLRLLEVGAGAGSAAEALLDELERRGRLGDVAEYRLTEPNAFLRRRAVRSLAARFPGLALVDGAFDIDADAAAQGLGDARFDLVLAVNVLHIARDLGAALARLRSLLAPGGRLVAGECLRLFDGQTIAVELVFQQLRSFTAVDTDPALRPRHGFLSPGDWRRAFVAAGFDAIEVTPDLERIRDLYSRFFTGAVSGRNPSPAAT